MQTIPAKPYAFTFDPAKAALLLIDLQGDFMLDGGFGEVQGGNLAELRRILPVSKQVLAAARAAGLQIIHTREGHPPSLSDCPTPKLLRQGKAPNGPSRTIGDAGPAGDRMLVQGEALHDIIPEMRPIEGEIVIDKPGKGAFYNTELHQLLVNRQISSLFIVGVTSECCVSTTLREANDRGFDCCLVSDMTAGYASSLVAASIEMACYANGLFGFVSDSAALLPSLSAIAAARPQFDAWDGSLDIASLSNCYSAGVVTPEAVIEEVYRRIALPNADPAVWLHLFPKKEVLAAARKLRVTFPDPANRPALFGIPFSVKDSIDCKNVPTTGACPAFSFVPEVDAVSVARLVENGALVIGKVNLDQLATGLVGMRSPYGQPASVFSKDHVSGGSSSGSCVSVASHQVSFSLATDTAGSGRVPAAFNSIIGFKPTRATISTAGVVPCCLSLDCIAIEALTISDSRIVWNALYDVDESEPFAKVARPPWALAPRAILQPQEDFTFAVPGPETESRKLVSDEFNALFDSAVARLKSIGGKLFDEMDYTVFEEAGRLLYEGSFVAERVSGVKEWYDQHPAAEEDALLPEIRSIYDAAATSFTAADAWEDLRKQMASQRLAAKQFAGGFQILVVPTVPFHPTKKEYLANPIKLNHKLGKFTHYANILDLTGVSVPAGFTEAGMPFAITILGQSFTDGLVLEIAERFERELVLAPGGRK